MTRPARWWAYSPLDRCVHVLVDQDEPAARCGHVLLPGTHRHDQPPPGPPCEACRRMFLTDFTPAPAPSTAQDDDEQPVGMFIGKCGHPVLISATGFLDVCECDIT